MTEKSMVLRNMSELGITQYINPNWFTSCCYLQASDFPEFQQLTKSLKGFSWKLLVLHTDSLEVTLPSQLQIKS